VALEAKFELAEVAISWRKPMKSPELERNAVPPALPGEAVGPLAHVGPLHAKDGVGCAVARLLAGLANAVHACGLVPLASVGAAQDVVYARELALVERACARFLVPFFARLFGSQRWLAGPAAAFCVALADGLESAVCPPHRLALVAVVCSAGSPPSSGISWPACLLAFSGDRYAWATAHSPRIPAAALLPGALPP
jgi:hypothetical protein